MRGVRTQTGAAARGWPLCERIPNRGGLCCLSPAAPSLADPVLTAQRHSVTRVSTLPARRALYVLRLPCAADLQDAASLLIGLSLPVPGQAG